MDLTGKKFKDPMTPLDITSYYSEELSKAKMQLVVISIRQALLTLKDKTPVVVEVLE